jgi:head-tail adaptor
MSAEFAGTLTERILIEAPVATRNALGLQEFGWVAVCRCLASVVAEGVGPEKEAMALSAMQRFRVTLRRREGIAIDQRVSWRGGQMMIRQLIADPQAKDRLTLRCEEVRSQ